MACTHGIFLSVFVVVNTHRIEETNAKNKEESNPVHAIL